MDPISTVSTFAHLPGSAKAWSTILSANAFALVELTGSAVVHICEYSGFGGRCMVVEKSQADRDALYANNVESFEVLRVQSSGGCFFNHMGYADSGVHIAGE